MKEFKTIEPRATENRKVLMEIEQKTGLNLKLISPQILSRLNMLSNGSEILKDELHAMDLALGFFKFYEKQEFPFSVEEKRTILLGSLLSDIGKTGPSDASEKLSASILNMYKVDKHFNIHTTDIHAFLNEFLNEKQKEYTSALNTININGDMKMSEFFHLHAKWTLDILKRGKGVPYDTIVAAASHHILEGENPAGVIKLSRAAKMVILLDKYDARRRRGMVTHQAAIDWLKDRIEEKTTNTAEKEEFLELILKMDTAFQNSNIYDSGAKINNGEYLG